MKLMPAEIPHSYNFNSRHL